MRRPLRRLLGLPRALGRSILLRCAAGLLCSACAALSTRAGPPATSPRTPAGEVGVLRAAVGAWEACRRGAVPDLPGVRCAELSSALSPMDCDGDGLLSRVDWACPGNVPALAATLYDLGTLGQAEVLVAADRAGEGGAEALYRQLLPLVPSRAGRERFWGAFSRHHLNLTARLVADEGQSTPRVELEWLPYGDGSAAYAVERDALGAPGREVFLVPPVESGGTPRWSDRSVVPGATYRYSVVPIRQAAQPLERLTEVTSNWANVSPGPRQAPSVAVNAVEAVVEGGRSDGLLEIRWQLLNPGSAPAGFRVEETRTNVPYGLIRWADQVPGATVRFDETAGRGVARVPGHVNGGTYSVKVTPLCSGAPCGFSDEMLGAAVDNVRPRSPKVIRRFVQFSESGEATLFLSWEELYDAVGYEVVVRSAAAGGASPPAGLQVLPDLCGPASAAGPELRTRASWIALRLPRAEACSVSLRARDDGNRQSEWAGPYPFFEATESGGGRESGPPQPEAAIVTTWDAPSQNEDGTPVTDLWGYYVYRREEAPDGVSSCATGNDPWLNPADQKAYCPIGYVCAPGTGFSDRTARRGSLERYAVVAVDEAGTESEPSLSEVGP